MSNFFNDSKYFYKKKFDIRFFFMAIGKKNITGLLNYLIKIINPVKCNSEYENFFLNFCQIQHISSRSKICESCPY